MIGEDNCHHYVYMHVDPETKEIVYYGHGRAGRAWACGSEKTVLRGEAHYLWQKSLMDNGYCPGDWVVILEKGMTKDDARAMEYELIEKSDTRFNMKMGQGNLKVTESLFQKMKDLRSSGLSYSQISSEIGVSSMTVYRAINKHTKTVSGY